ncbi:DUF2092 domain-containing protein [Flavobacterium hauense]
MRKTLAIILMTICFSGYSQTAKVDSLAVIVLNRMSDIIGSLHSCSFTLNTAYDESGEHGLEKKFCEHVVLMKGPDKMLVQARGENFHKGYWYNGEQIIYYSYDQNNYSVIDGQNTIMETIDHVHDNYGIDFPASDFFYPTFTDDVIAFSSTVAYLGKKKVEGKDCFHVFTESPTRIVQIWVSDDAYNLPLKFLIIYKDKENSPQYIASFSDWKINPDLPDALFDFNPPPMANEIKMINKSTQNK